jgi:hydrogenase maturation protein HypF
MTVSLLEGRRIHLRGTVQGVGMRPWIYRTAVEHGITGTVCNETSGVTIEAFGGTGALDAFLATLRSSAPPAAVIDTFKSEPITPRESNGFVIVESRPGEERRVSIPPELATCDDCVAEILDPGNRRYRYPFTNCTNCGPRFTIATDVPYDRSATTMAPFRMCPQCQREYDDPGDRRFHAQPNACKVCGPTLSVLLDTSGHALTAQDPIRFAADQIAAGSIVAVKGLGGFHLACDATSTDAVARLRARKRRDEKPFAVMVADLEAAEQIVDLSLEARALLTSVERPVVIAPARAGTSIATEVAPRNPMLGVMLPYTPLHHLLLRDSGRPLVMTSANLSEEPIVYRNDEAMQRLTGIADVILGHDREIVTRCDDSVATIIAGHPVLLRRSRGYVPRAINLNVDVKTPVLATGALLKNTFCLAAGRRAWLGPHIGDLENEATREAFEEAIERMERFLGFRGEIIAHDLHPDYVSTRYAQARRGHRVPVQHHHAHVASAVAEHRLSGPVIGVAFDGTGFGTDGTAWGGEFLVVNGASCVRLATFRPLSLPGGDLAIRQPWRIALAALTDAFGRGAPVDAFPVFQAVRPSHVLMVRQMLDVRLNSPLARGVGRYFDAFGALVLARPRARYEGQVAFEFDMAADPNECGRYTFDVDHGTAPPEIDLRATLREAARDVLDGTTAALVSARFHNTLIAATTEMVREIASTCGRLPVVLTGGCFQNGRLATGVADSLAGNLDVYLHERVPPGDGGIALGQAVVAAVS